MQNLDNSAAFEQAISLYNRGDYSNALPLFEQSRKMNVKTNFSLRNKGLCEFKLQKFRDAISTLETSRSLDPHDPMTLEALGLSYAQVYEYTLALDPLLNRIAQSGPFSESCYQGIIFIIRAQRNFDLTIKYINEKAQHSEPSVNLGILRGRLFCEKGDREEASKSLLILKNWESNVTLLTELGNIERQFHRFKECERYWLAALQLSEQQKNFALCEKILIDLLQIHSHAGQPASIRQIAKNLLLGFPTDQNRIHCLVAFVEKSMLDDAEQLIMEIQDQQKYAKELQVARARIARDKQDIAHAVGLTLSLLQKTPDDPFMMCNLGLLLSDCGQAELAGAAYMRALKIRPDYHMAKWNLAISKFLLGDYESAFELAEIRWSLEHLMGKRPQITKELERNEKIAGRKIFVYFEQGLGDTLQFCRFAQSLSQLGAHVWLRVQNPLTKIIANSFPDIHVLGPEESPPSVDSQIALLSIPYLLKTNQFNIPAPTSYLQPTAERFKFWSKYFKNSKRPRVGLAWSGSSTHKNDRNRSIPFHLLQRLLLLPVDFVAIQKDIPNEMIQSPPANLIIPGPELDDFNDTAQMLQFLDLVISVDSSPAHLAGALGKEVWLLLPRPCDWRWMQEASKTPWYQNMRIFRQNTDRNWLNVIDELEQEINNKFLGLH